MFLALVGGIVGVKAWQNRRDVVDVPPLEQAVAALPRYESFQILDPYDVPGGWYKVQLHVHTDASIDGRWSVEEALAAYAAAGYDFVAITDHDKVTVPERVPDGLIVIPAEENTIAFPFWPLGQHAIHLFAREHVKKGSAVQRFEAMRTGGGLISIAHPHWPGNLDTGRWEMKHLLAAPQFTLMEISNPYSNTELNTATWHETVLRRGPAAPVWAVAVDDAHDAAGHDRAWVMVRAEGRSLAALREALERGSLYPSTGAAVEFRVGDGQIVVEPASAPIGGEEAGHDGQSEPRTGNRDEGRDEERDEGRDKEWAKEWAKERFTVSFIDASGQIVATHDGPLPAVYSATGAEGFVRIEVVVAASGGRAWSQPFWIVPEVETL